MPQLLIGHARACITPSVPVHMAGYGNRKGLSQGVHDDLFANAVAISDGGQTILLIAADILSLDATEAARLKETVAARAGVAPEAVLFNATHTHAGPAVNTVVGALFERQHCDYTLERCAAIAAEAVGDLRPARLLVGAAPLDIGCNRRERTADGTIKLGINREGQRLAEVVVWRFARGGAGPDIVLFNSPNHGTTLGGDNLLISSEWMGAAVRNIEAAEPLVRAIFLQGCCGDINVYHERHNFEQVAEHGVTACAAVRQALGAMSELDPLPLRNAAWIAQLPLRAGGSGPCALHGLRLGEAAIVALGGEAFVEFALHARRVSPLKSTMALGYSDGNSGYLPVEKAYGEGGYEVTVADQRGYGCSWDPKMEYALKREIESLVTTIMQEA